LIVIEDALVPAELAMVCGVLERVPFTGGELTAGITAAKVKQNEQARGDDPEVIALGHRVKRSLEVHSVMRSLVRPVRWSSLLFSRYGPTSFPIRKPTKVVRCSSGLSTETGNSGPKQVRLLFTRRASFTGSRR